QGLKTGEVISFVIPLEDGITKKNLGYIKWFTDKLEETFPEFGILSLSVAANYRDNGEELLNAPFINQDILADQNWNAEEWKNRVKKDSAVYGVFLGRNFDYAQVAMLLPFDYNEIKTFRRVAEFLEQRKISQWEWYLKADIYPVSEFSQVTTAGWAIGRGLTDAALLSDILKLSTIGLGLSWLLFFFSLISWRQATIATLVTAMSFLWTRGSIGLLQFMGAPVYERVYILIVFTAQIVAGISFTEHKFASYNEWRRLHPDLSRAGLWQKARAVNQIMFVTAVIAILNFATLYQIGVRGILEVGIFAALGIVYLLILAMWFLPALHTIIGGEEAQASSCFLARAGNRWNQFLTGLIGACQKFFHFDYYEQPAGEKRRAKQAICLTAGVLFLAIGLIGLDYIPGLKKDFDFLPIRTKPLEYIHNTIVYRASQLLNWPGRYGFDRVPLLLQGDIDDPAFISRANDFQKAVKNIKQVREVTSVVDTIKLISRESYHLSLPKNRQQVHDSLSMIADDLGPVLKSQLWFDGGLVVFASTAMEDSNELGQVIDGLLQTGQKDFSDLRVVAFGKIPAYPQVDKYIRLGKPWNLINSQWLVIMVCAVWVFWRNRKIQSRLKLVGWRTGLVISVPFVFASSVIALVMMAFRVPLDQATACITALAINAAIDFSLYLVADYQTALLDGKNKTNSLNGAMLAKGRVILTDILLNSLCFAPLIVSNFIPVQHLGWIMVVMMLTCGFGSLILMPALLPWCVKEKLLEKGEKK
ncbi:MAG: MMPL family transporter, partial [Patescibacteria group bacterium]